MTDCTTFQLGEATFAAESAGKDFPFLRTGSFRDSRGREFVITVDLLDALVRNFEGNAAAQEIPVDIMHRKDEAAGWINRIYRVGEVLYAQPNWNGLGRQLVGDKIYRYVSATIDMAGRVLRSISLTNFPAVTDLTPLELSAATEQDQDPDLFVEVDTASTTAAPGTEPTSDPDDIEAGAADPAQPPAAPDATEPEVPTQEEPDTTNPDSVEATAPADPVPVKEPSMSKQQSAPEKDPKQPVDSGGTATPPADTPTPETVEASAAPSQPKSEPKSEPKAQSAAETKTEPASPVTADSAAELVATVRGMFQAELSSFQSQVAEIVATAQQEAAALTKEMVADFKSALREEQDLTELSHSLTSVGRHALPVDEETLLGVLKSVPKNVRGDVVNILQAVAESGTVDFSEIGTSAADKTPPKKATMDSGLQGMLAEWVEEGGTVDEWFKANSDVVGDKDQYDLSDFSQ